MPDHTRESGTERTRDSGDAGRGGHPVPDRPSATSNRVERLGIVDYTNVAPLHWGLLEHPGGSGGLEAEGATRRADPVASSDPFRVELYRGVPTDLNRRLRDGEIDLTLISSIEFLRHRAELTALPDFSIATLGPVYSVMLFHRRPWDQLAGARIAVSTDSATSVALLQVLLAADGIDAELVPMAPDLAAMLADCDAALLIGDAALEEGVHEREIDGHTPLRTDLGEAWYARTRLPFTFAVWASRKDRPPSQRLVAELRAARERGLGHLQAVSAVEADKRNLSPVVVQRYLSNFRYYFEPPDRDGLIAFGRRAIPGFDDHLSFWDI